MRAGLPSSASLPSGAAPKRSPSRHSRHTAFGAILGLVLALGLAIAPVAAQADVGMQVIERCTHGESISGFPQQAYRRALQEIPTEVEEYSECGELIRKAQLAAATAASSHAAGAPAPAPSPTTPLSTTPAEQRAIESAHHSGSQPVLVGNQIIRPGVVHANIASAISSLPDPLLAVLALLLAGALALGAREITNRVISTRRHD